MLAVAVLKPLLPSCADLLLVRACCCRCRVQSGWANHQMCGHGVQCGLQEDGPQLQPVFHKCAARGCLGLRRPSCCRALPPPTPRRFLTSPPSASQRQDVLRALHAQVCAGAGWKLRARKLPDNVAEPRVSGQRLQPRRHVPAVQVSSLPCRPRA